MNDIQDTAESVQSDQEINKYVGVCRDKDMFFYWEPQNPGETCPNHPWCEDARHDYYILCGMKWEIGDTAPEMAEELSVDKYPPREFHPNG